MSLSANQLDKRFEFQDSYDSTEELVEVDTFSQKFWWQQENSPTKSGQTVTFILHKSTEE